MGKSIYKHYNLKRNIPRNQELDRNLIILLALLGLLFLYLLPECLTLKKQNNEIEKEAYTNQEPRYELSLVSPEEGKKIQCYEYIEAINESIINKFQHKLTKVNIQEGSAELELDGIDYKELYALINDLEERKELKVSSIEISNSSSIIKLNLIKI